ncbi:MAG: hypothetical protein QXG00_07730 [Candidatus Woesearchaeota archaeon]
MALVRIENLKKLDKVISPISLGLPFIEWAESKAQELVDKTTTKNVVDLKNLLKYQNTTVVLKSSKNKSIFKASLNKSKDKFEIIIDENQVINDSEKKFIIAHEIAHTLFYNYEDNEYKRILNLSYGSKQLEDICDFIALCLLLPRRFISEEIKYYTFENNSLRKRNESFLKFIFHLSAKYQLDWHYVMFRLITILSFLPNSLCIEFSKKDTWKIKWVFQTESLYSKNLYIPFRNKAINKFPSAKESFNIILDDIIFRHKNFSTPYGSIVVGKDHFKTLYQGNIKQFLIKHFTEQYDKLKIYYRINHLDNLILLFPFDGLLK